MKLPKEIKVGSQNYKIVERSETSDGMLGEAYAYTLKAGNLIVMRSDMPIERKRSVLVHELLHALIFTYSRSERKENDSSFDEWEHYFIGILEEPFTLLLRDNPELVEFLTYDA